MERRRVGEFPFDVNHELGELRVLDAFDKLELATVVPAAFAILGQTGFSFGAHRANDGASMNGEDCERAEDCEQFGHLEFKAKFGAEEIVVAAIHAVLEFTLLEGVFDLGDEILTEFVAEPDTQTPNVV